MTTYPFVACFLIIKVTISTGVLSSLQQIYASVFFSSSADILKKVKKKEKHLVRKLFDEYSEEEKLAYIKDMLAPLTAWVYFSSF